MTALELELLTALQDLVEQLRLHHKMNVRKDFDLMIADAAARTAIHNAKNTKESVV